MGRRALELGEHSEIDATPQRRDESGRWKTLSNNRRRNAERWRARVSYRGYDGVRGDVSRFGGAKAEAVAAVRVALAERLMGAAGEMTGSTLLVDAGRA